jgi:hypothetical protein
VCPRAGLDAVAKTKSQPLPGLEPPIIQPVAQRYTTELSRLLTSTRHSISQNLSSTFGHNEVVRGFIRSFYDEISYWKSTPKAVGRI